MNKLHHLLNSVHVLKVINLGLSETRLSAQKQQSSIQNSILFLTPFTKCAHVLNGHNI
jgi:hypothetical protein